MWVFIFGFLFSVGFFNVKFYLMYLCYVKLCVNLFYELFDRIYIIKVKCDLYLKNKIFILFLNSNNLVLFLVEFKLD